MAIVHVENDVGILDLLIERRPPFSPESVVEEMAGVLLDSGLCEVTGDKFASGFCSETFARHNLTYRHSDLSTSDYFAGFLPILNSRRCKLLDNKRLQTQLSSLERRASRVGAKDAIGHPPLAHDDLAAAVAGLMVRLVGTRDYRIKTWHVPIVGPSWSESCSAMGGSILANRSFGLPGSGYDSREKPGGFPAGSAGAGATAGIGWLPGRKPN